MEIQSVLTGCPFLPIIPATAWLTRTAKLSLGVDGNIIGVPIRPKWPFYILNGKGYHYENRSCPFAISFYERVREYKSNICLINKTVRQQRKQKTDNFLAMTFLLYNRRNTNDRKIFYRSKLNKINAFERF